MFKKAERKAAYLRAALCGTSGSGKTYGALLLARGLVGDEGKIALIDTERSSACLYSDVTNFDVAELNPPYTPKRYIELIKEASKSYQALIIDSLTHGWAGQGGVLDMHDNATRAQRTQNSYAAWRDVTPEHSALVDTILSAPCHVLCTMRSKTAYEIQEVNGRKSPVKVGLAPVQRDGMEYEFTVVWDVMVNSNIATASKDRTRLWAGRNEVITLAHGQELRQWLDAGERLEESAIAEALTSVSSQEEVTAFWKKLGLSPCHPQYKAVVALFQEAKQRISTTTTSNDVAA